MAGWILLKLSLSEASDITSLYFEKHLHIPPGFCSMGGRSGTLLTNKMFGCL